VIIIKKFIIFISLLISFILFSCTIDVSSSTTLSSESSISNELSKETAPSTTFLESTYSSITSSPTLTFETSSITSSITTTTTTTTITTTTTTTEELYRNYEEQLLLNLSNYGLGNDLIKYVSNDRDYNWYVNQLNTGVHAYSNCGPASIEMVSRWSDQLSRVTAKNAREKFRPNGGWWYDEDIKGALDLYRIPHETSYITKIDDLISVIESGRIALINNNMSLIPYNSISSERTNRFYSNVTGHYLIVKGYLITDIGTFFEVYDPYTINSRYSDNTPKGKNRYYEAESLIDSIVSWYIKIYEIY